MSITMSGFCPHHYRNVAHGVPWCPDIPAIISVDYNSAREDVAGDGALRHRLSALDNLRLLSRPVSVGEFVLVVCDGEMVTWGQVEELDGRYYVRDSAEVGPSPTIAYKYTPGEQTWAEAVGFESVASTRATRASCPTPCDDVCDADCHEGHLVTWKRSHQPEDCPGRVIGP